MGWYPPGTFPFAECNIHYQCGCIFVGFGDLWGIGTGQMTLGL